MNNEDSFRLMELMIKMGFRSEVVMLTLAKCCRGLEIGDAFLESVCQWNEECACKTDTDKSAQDKTTCDSLEKTCSTTSSEQPTKPQEDKSE